MKMKKLFIPIFMICLMAMSVSALVKYEGAPTVPYIVYGQVSWNEQLLSGARLEISNSGTGFVKQITTDNQGYWQEEAPNWLTNSKFRIPVQGDDVITVRVLDGCGTGDTCEKSITVMSIGYESSARIDFDITGELSCPPINCPSCSCGGGGSSGGNCPDVTCTEEECVEIVCPKETICPEPVTCPEEKVCPDVEEPICPPPEDDFSGAIAVIFAIILSIGGGIKIYRNRAGGVTFLHRHRGILGYHNPETQHRNILYRHAAFSKNPKQYAEDIKRIEGL